MGTKEIRLPLRIFEMPLESYYGQLHNTCHFVVVRQREGRVLGMRQFFFKLETRIERRLSFDPIMDFSLILRSTEFDVDGFLWVIIECKGLSVLLKNVDVVLSSFETSLERGLQNLKETVFPLKSNWTAGERIAQGLPLRRLDIFPTQANESFNLLHILSLRVCSISNTEYQSNGINITLYRQ